MIYCTCYREIILRNIRELRVLEGILSVNDLWSYFWRREVSNILTLYFITKQEIFVFENLYYHEPVSVVLKWNI